MTLDALGHRATVMLCANTGWYIYNFRASTIKALLGHGYRVAVCCPADAYVPRLVAMGATHYRIRLSRSGTNLSTEISSLLTCTTAFRACRPHIVLNFTPKCNVYGAIAATILGIPFVNNVSGVGYSLSNASWLARVMHTLYSVTQPRARVVFFQNPNDHEVFVQRGYVSASQAKRVYGSGISLTRFAFAPRPYDGKVKCLFVGRLLEQKGVQHFVEAALRLRNAGDFTFAVLGPLDLGSPTAIQPSLLEAWVRTGAVSYLGFTDNVEAFLPHYDVVVLPSVYGEGIPRSLMEAAAMGKVIVTTDHPGCRETVVSGSGYLLSEPSADAICDVLVEFARLTASERYEMAEAGRQLAERRFAEGVNIDAYLEVISDILGAGLTR